MKKPKNKYEKRKWWNDRKSKRIAKLCKRYTCYSLNSDNQETNVIQKKHHHLPSPKILDFDSNIEETLKYFSSIRAVSSSDNIKIDLIPLELISSSCILVLAAEMNRHSLNSGRRFIARDYNKWKDSIKEDLYNIGFFKYMKMKKKRQASDNGIQWVQLFSQNIFVQASNNVAGLQNKILALIPNNINPIAEKRLYNALFESLANTLEHAYPSFYKGSSEKNRWWCAASFDKKANILKIMTYDMGITIPLSVKNKYIIKDNKVIEIQKDNKKRILSILPEIIQNLLDNHGKIIKEIIYNDEEDNHGNSASKLPNRGYGLSNMRNYIKKYFKSGVFTIISNKGYCKFNINHGIEIVSYGESNNALQGTLIEWEICIEV